MLMKYLSTMNERQLSLGSFHCDINGIRTIPSYHKNGQLGFIAGTRTYGAIRAVEADEAPNAKGD